MKEFVPRWCAAAMIFIACFAVVACDSYGEPAAATPTRAATPSPTVRAPTVALAVTCAPPYPTGAPTADTVMCADPRGMEAASVIRIIDGDTLVVRLRGDEETVRLFGIDAPERGDACDAAATDLLATVAGTRVLLVPDVRNRDRYGRLLRYVYTPGGESIDARLIASGVAHAWTRDGALRDALIVLETRARDAGTGCLWR